MRWFAVALALLAALVVRLEGQVQGCANTQYPPELTPSALVDSAHAIADLALFADPAKPMIFSVVFHQGDSVAQLRALDKNDAAAAVSLSNYVRHAPPRELWAFRVRISGGASPALTLERSTYCPPIRPGGQRIATITGSIATAGSALTPLPQQNMSAADDTIPVEALISAEGRVMGASVLRSSGNSNTDARIVRDLQRLKFTPAKLDGQPIEAVFRSAGHSPRP